MSALAPAGSNCATRTHPPAPATWTCQRCGAFMCEACERRMRPDALPMCPNCWGLREQRVAAAPKATRLENAGLWLGGLSFLCLPPIVMASLVVNIIVLSRAVPGQRSKGLIGLGLTFGGVLVTITVFVLVFARGA